MAVDAYERFIQEVDGEDVKHELRQIQQDHKRHAGDLAERIRSLGGKPEYDTGFAGFIADAKAAVDGMDRRGTTEILKKAYDGEDKGIAKAEEIVKGDLDEESMRLVKGILSDDHDHLRKMVGMIAGFEEKH